MDINLRGNPVIKEMIDILLHFGTTLASDIFVLGKLKFKREDGKEGEVDTRIEFKEYEDEAVWSQAFADLRQKMMDDGQSGASVQTKLDAVSKFFAINASPREAEIFRLLIARMQTREDRREALALFVNGNDESRKNQIKALSRHTAVIECFTRRYIEAWANWSESLSVMDFEKAQRVQKFLRELGAIERIQFKLSIGRFQDKKERMDKILEILRKKSQETKRSAAISRGYISPQAIDRNILPKNTNALLDRLESIIEKIGTQGLVGLISQIANFFTSRKDAWEELGTLEKWWVGLGFGRLSGADDFEETNLERNARRWNLGAFSVIFVWFWISFLVRSQACFLLGVIPSLLWLIPYAGATAWMRKISPKLESFVKSISAPPAVAVMCFWWMFIASNIDPVYSRYMVFVLILAVATFVVFSWRYPWGQPFFSGLAHVSLVLLIFSSIGLFGIHAVSSSFLEEKHDQIREFQSGGRLMAKDDEASRQDQALARMSQPARALHKPEISLPSQDPARAASLPRIGTASTISLSRKQQGRPLELGQANSKIIITLPTGTWVYPDKNGKPNTDLIWKPEKPRKAEKIKKPIVQMRLPSGRMISAQQIKILEGPSNVKGQIAWAVL